MTSNSTTGELIFQRGQTPFEEPPFRFLVREFQGTLVGGTRFVRLMVNPGVLALNRLVAIESVKNPKLAGLLYEAGPQPTLRRFAELLRAWAAKGMLEIPDPDRAADHYFSMLRGMMQLRLIMSMDKQPTEDEIQRHVEDSVDMFLCAYGRG